MPRLDLENPRPTFFQRKQIAVYGYIEIGNVMKPGWKEPIPHYLFKCPKHGYVVNYPQGYYRYGSQHIPVTNDNGFISELRCPKCNEEKQP